MLDWFSDTIMSIVTFVPALFVEQDSPSFGAVRAMFGLILIVAIFSLIAALNSRAVFSQCRKKIAGLFARRQ